MLDPTRHCTNSGSDLLDPTAYVDFTLHLYRGAKPPPVRLECKMHVGCWIQQVTTRVGAVTCWIQQSVSPKQVVGFTCVFNSEIDQIKKSSVPASRGRVSHDGKTDHVERRRHRNGDPSALVCHFVRQCHLDGFRDVPKDV